MRVAISAATINDHLTVAQLGDWLRGNGRLRRTASVRLVPQQAGDHMGAADLIEVFLSDGSALLGLISAYANWRQTGARAGSGVTFTCEDVSVTVHDGDPETVEQLLRVLREGRDRSSGSSGEAPGAGNGAA